MSTTKGPHAFRTISETADALGVQQHVLRFWETKFTFVRPTKRAGGRRFYRPQDIVLLQGIKALLHDRGYTIRGVQKLYKDQGQKAILAAAGDDFADYPVDHSESELSAISSVASAGDVVHAEGLLTEASRAELSRVLAGLEAAKAGLGAVLGK
ncbi:MerR family transcriptional regulator [Asticcacaulis sp. SL142]|uniref:MerR family transcriptional regulator n=1 Tax=Asticcacaulis sp. SL142 TaxID=2995155 RepID=UPI00226C98E9|nr:MerR family transcriptional regulator [Asticcacaulis sp. SL142]WAC48813.1 MerR family transcriptional regulator [Asticcacaulis sp. SL142]